MAVTTAAGGRALSLGLVWQWLMKISVIGWIVRPDSFGVSSFSLTTTMSVPCRRTLLVTSLSRCWAKGRRGNLGSIVDESEDDDDDYNNSKRNTGNPQPASTTTKQKSKSSTTMSKTSTSTTTSSSGAAISPALMEWMSTRKTSDPERNKQETSFVESDNNDQDNATTSSSRSKRQQQQRRGGALPSVSRSPMASLLSDVGLDDENENDDDGSSGDAVDVQIAAAAKKLDELVSQSITSVPLNQVLEQVGLLLSICSKSQADASSSSSSSSATTSHLSRRRRRKWMVNNIGTPSASWNYRLAWVGSDASVCHIGTGLHKVPLARLQEVFLSFQPRNRLQLLEVIRVLGPFPNIKNTLRGTHESVLIDNPVLEASGSTGSSSSQLPWQQWEIDWTSMIDGVGKEILAGNSDRVRKVSLQVAFCHPKVLVAVIPPTITTTTTTATAAFLAMGKNQRGGGSGSSSSKSKVSSTQVIRTDPLEDNGAHVLVFVRDEEMDDKLEKLRVA